MPFRTITVRADWRSIEERQKVALVARRNALQFALVGYGLTTLIVGAWYGPAPWFSATQTVLFSAAFLWMPIRTATWDSQGKGKTLGVAGLVLALATVLALLTSPFGSISPASPGPLLSPWLSLLILPMMLALLVWSGRRHRGLYHELGLRKRAWIYQGAIGLSLGAALGLHLWTAASAPPYGPNPEMPPPATLAWLIATGAGLIGLGQELALRGALFRLLAAESRGLRASVILRIITIGAPLYLAPVLNSIRPGALLLGLLYGTVFGILAIVLRASFRSITAPLAANVAFYVFATLVVLA